LTIPQAQLWKGGIIAVTPDGRKALSSNSHVIVLWDLTTGEEIRTLEGERSGKPPLNWVAFSPDGKFALSAGGADTTNWESLRGQANREGRKLILSLGIITLWEVDTGRPVRSFRGHWGRVIYASFSPDGKRILSGGEDNSLMLWNVATGKRIRTWKEVDSSLAGVALSSDGKRALSGGNEHLKLWNLANGNLIHTMKGHDVPVTFVGFFKAGVCGLSASQRFSDNPLPEHVIKIWNLKTGKCMKTLTKVGNPLALSKTGKKLLLTSGRVWDLPTGKFIRTLDDGENWGALTAVFSPNEKLILSADKDGVIKLWDLATGKRLRTFWSKGVAEAVRGLAFSPDGKRALACGDGRRVKLWDLTTGKEIRSFVNKQDW
jgi:WD40 repeat protein